MRIFAIAFVLACLGATHAEAGRIPILYQSGLESFESGPLPSPYDKDPDLVGWRAGYVCDVTGVFFTYFSIGDCRPAAVLGNRYNTDDELAATIEKIYPSAEIPFWGRHGWKIILGAIALLVVAGYLLRDPEEEDTEEEIDADPKLVASADFDEGRTERAKPLPYDPSLYAKPQIDSHHAQQFAATHATHDPHQALAYRATDAVTAIPPRPTPRRSHAADLPYAVTQPLSPMQALPPRRAARGSQSEHQLERAREALCETQRAPSISPSDSGAGHTRLGWQPPKPRR